MRTDIIIVDEFYADPESVRNYALKLDYYYPYESAEAVESGRERPTWMASRFRSPQDCPFKSSTRLVSALEEATGEEIDIAHWNADFPVTDDGKAAPLHKQKADRGCLWNCAFHCKPDNGQQLGNGVHNHVTDTWNGVGMDGWAGLIYLNLDAPLDGGLKLWRNLDPRRNFDWMTPSENWQLIDDLGNVPNRLILARGNLPHSGAAGWGNALENGRFYQTFFFRTLAPRSRQALWIALLGWGANANSDPERGRGPGRHGTARPRRRTMARRQARMAGPVASCPPGLRREMVHLNHPFPHCLCALWRERYDGLSLRRYLAHDPR